MDMERWRGRVALVTGASSGIGAAVAAGLYRAGLKVAVCARRLEKLEDVRRSLDATEEQMLCMQVDLRSEESILSMFEHIRKVWGGVDVLVNNAGLGHNASLIDGDVGLWREMLDVNVLALCICTQQAVQDMLRRGQEGHVIHLSSMSGHRVPKASGVYSASKYAVRSLTEGLRKELREREANIRISSISPGFVQTEFAEKYHQSKEAAEEIYGQYQTLRAEDLAETVCFVLSAPAHMQVHDILMRPTSQES
ncbi:MAG TPA: short-chain dehydrogenase [Myxococcales bacterium]|nr:short-chain dehydrogenase [Deltaproteobacteria bacterium]HAA53497.1 short-chain dehydrogenase [Myxococcales bacterium]|tara:strand:- start:5042 stop:5797 length:756 start_codon:yes stop_codon:yes gene_type:complete